MSRNIPIIPFLLNQRECNITYCTFYKEGYCDNHNIDILESTYDLLGKRLKVGSDGHTVVLGDSSPFTCTYYELAEKRCPECYNELKYSEKEVNYVCYVCGHGIRD